jgi:hypothetical protein
MVARTSLTNVHLDTAKSTWRVRWCGNSKLEFGIADAYHHHLMSCLSIDQLGSIHLPNNSAIQKLILFIVQSNTVVPSITYHLFIFKHAQSLIA